ncbi:MAG: DNA-binding domain-containing protein [Erythrobacter sp.]
MRLAELQSAFMANVLDDGGEMPGGWGKAHSNGLNVYRGNYRNSQIEALRDTYAKTQGWAGEEPFKQAAINHVIANPCASWTIDDAGARFDETCARFFKDAPEVAELAWLEWAMLVAFSSADTKPLDLEQFGLQTSVFGEEQWLGLQLELVPDLAARITEFDLNAMWRWVEGGQGARPDYHLSQPSGVFVWREDERATFQMVATDEVEVVQAVQSGQSYGEICMMLAGSNPSPEQAQEAAMRAGGILGRWVQEGFVTALKT